MSRHTIKGKGLIYVFVKFTYSKVLRDIDAPARAFVSYQGLAAS
jgi:hypothetical protein